jgi:hypothetical protein
MKTYLKMALVSLAVIAAVENIPQLKSAIQFSN